MGALREVEDAIDEEDASEKEGSPVLTSAGLKDPRPN